MPITTDHPDDVWLLGVRIQAIPIDAVIDRLLSAAQGSERLIAAYVNVHSINLAQELLWFRQFLNCDVLSYCDSVGLVLAARILRRRLPGRYTPPDWFPELAAEYSRLGLSIYFLGSRPGVAETAAQKLKEQISENLVIHSHPGYFNDAPGSPENEAVVAEINRLQPHLLVVGMGQPRQERWLLENWSRLQVPAALLVGAMFDYLAGAFPRAPRWMTDNGLEWLGRLIFEPRRLGKRYMVGIPQFLWRIILEKIKPTTRPDV